MKRLLAVVLCLFFAFPAMAGIIDGYDPNEKVRPYRLDADGRMIGWSLVIDTCEAITDWTALSNDTTGIAVDLDHVMGATSLEFDKVDGTDNTIFGGIQKTLTAIDLTTIVENGGSFTASMNVSALTDIAYCFLRLGTSVSHYNEWRVDDNDMSVGWNSLRFNSDTPTSAGSTGNGWDPAVVLYIAIGCSFDLETSSLADLRVDHITARGGQQVSADINASSSSSSGPMAQVDVQQYGGNPVTTADADTGAGVDNLQRSINVVPADGGAVIGTEDLDTAAGLDHVNRVGIKVPGAGGAVTITGDGGSLDIDINAQTKATVRVSDDDAANTIANPMYMQISQDGTNAVAAAYPIPVSQDMAANAITNPLYFQISQDGTNAMATTYPLPISATVAQNLVSNPIWTQLSQDGTNAVDATHPVPISLDLAANLVTNPMWFRLSQDGTNAVDATHPVPISLDLAANLVTNPMWFRISQDGTNAVDATHPLPISKDLAVNATGNRIYVDSNLQFAGVASNTNGGNRSTETQTVTLADDDPALLAIVAMNAAVIVDDSAFVPATDSVNMAGFEYDDAATNPVEEGDGGAARMSANRNIYTTTRDASGNERGLDITATGGAEVDIATQTLPAVAVSKDNAVNATANRIWTASNLDQVAGNAVAVDAGNTSTGTQRVVNATDDPNLAKLTAWDDGDDRARTNIERDFDLDPLDATAGWTVGNDATANIALSSDHVQGTGSLTFDKVDGTNFTEAYIQKTITSVDLIEFQAHSLVEWNVYVSDLSEVAYSFVRLGTDNANYSEWRVLDDDMTIGVWNTAVVPGGTVEYTVVGTGLIDSAVTYVAVGVSFDAENDTLASIGEDAIVVHESHHTTSTIAAEVTSSVNSANVNVQKVGGGPTTTGAGNVGVLGTQRITVATNDVNAAAINASAAIMDDWDGTEDGAAATDGVQVMNEARTAQKAAVDNGDAVRPVTNDHGEAITAGYTWATDSNRAEEIDPLDQKYDPELIANVTNGADAGGATCPVGTDWCYYVSMSGFTNSGIQFVMDCDGGTLTATVECSLQAGAAATLSYEDVTNDVFGVASLIAAAGSATDLWIDNSGKLNTCTYVLIRIAAATGGNTGDWRIDATKTAM